MSLVSGSGGRAGGDPRPRRVPLAWAIAILADLVQIGALPLIAAGGGWLWNNVLDVAVGIALVALLGWHVAFLPTFVAELLPVVDLFPTWTAAVFLVTRARR